jgi:hypothetical protein
MTGGIPGGIGGLLGKLGLLGKGPAAADEGKVAAQALKAEGGEAEKPGLPRGALLGEDGALLAGLGYNPADRHTDQKNVAEKNAVARFLEELGGDAPATAPGNPREGATETKGETREAEARENTAPEEKRSEERGERAAGPAEEPREARRAKEPEEAERQRERDRDGQEKREDEDAQAQGWVAEEQEQEAPRKRRGLREADALGEHHRCRGHGDDGGQCLRKPVRGSAYCREHAALWVPPRRIDKA